MRFTLALAALVAVTSALPSSPQPLSKHALTTRQDFAEDDFEIQAEPDEQKRAVGWPEVSRPGQLDFLFFPSPHFALGYPYEVFFLTRQMRTNQPPFQSTG